MGDVRRGRGRFRTFLLAALGHYLANRWDHARAAKRGGRHSHKPIEAGLESRYRELRDELTPDQLYERRWALTVLEEALGRLRAESLRGRDPARFERLKGFLTGDVPGDRYRRAARDLGITEAAVKVAVHRLRRRYGQHLRDVIADTVGDPTLVDEELRYLLRVVS